MEEIAASRSRCRVAETVRTPSTAVVERVSATADLVAFSEVFSAVFGGIKLWLIVNSVENLLDRVGRNIIHELAGLVNVRFTFSLMGFSGKPEI